MHDVIANIFETHRDFVRRVDDDTVDLFIVDESDPSIEYDVRVECYLDDEDSVELSCQAMFGRSLSTRRTLAYIKAVSDILLESGVIVVVHDRHTLRLSVTMCADDSAGWLDRMDTVVGMLWHLVATMQSTSLIIQRKHRSGRKPKTDHRIPNPVRLAALSMCGLYFGETQQ